jgi:hypothetical protein
VAYDNPPKSLDESMFYGLTLDPDQKVFRDAIWDPEKIIVLCNSKAGSGKAQPIETLVPTPKGEVKLGDLKVGDYVFDRTGKPTKVLKIFPQGKQKAYKITFEDGRSTICGPEHLWTYRLNNSDKRLRTSTISEMYEATKDSLSTYVRYEIPNNKAVEYNTKTYEIDPYIIGLFISEFCHLDDKFSITTDEFSIVNQIGQILNIHPVKFSYKDRVWYFKNNSDCLVKSKDVLGKYYDELMVYPQYKKIPNEYLYGDINQRISLLQGLLDNGNTELFDSHRVVYTITSIGLLKDVRYLLHSLGISVNVHQHTRDAEHMYWELYINVTDETKLYLFKNSILGIELYNSFTSSVSDGMYEKIDNDFVGIKSIDILGYSTEMVCIYVENNEHLYLTNDFIVTHNTVISTAVATLLVKYGFYDGVVYIMAPTQEQAQGYLPGGIEEKSAPYMQPLIDALITIGEDPFEVIKSDENIQAQKNGTAYIDVCTDTFMRGINLENKVVIIDEAQNFYFDQLKKVLTRIHDNSKAVVIGSSIQCDIIKHPERSGFVPYIKAFEKLGSDKCAICNLTKNYRGWLSNFADAVMLKDYI